MDVLNKLRSTVSNTVSSLSGVLPGNPVTREFEATSHICSAGPGLLWKVYAGYKKSTKQEASIFVFEKKQLERWPRESRETILESLKRGVTQLTKLRHPQVLIVQHPLEESRDSLAFAAEPVFASLANVLGSHDNLSSSQGPEFKDFQLYDIEIKYGLLQIGEGLSFLHNDVKLLHNNLCPESIVINQQGAWKIFGFDFCVHSDGKSDIKAGTWRCAEHSAYLPHVAQPSLDYLAPEAGLANTRTSASDLFSLGVIIHALYQHGAPPIAYHNDFQSYKTRVSELKNLPKTKFIKIPEGLREIAKMLLHFTAELRPDAHQFRKVEFFEDVGVKTLNYLDSLFQWDKLQKSQFYKGLPPIIQKFPHRVCLHRVIPCLGKEFANPSMVPFVLPVVLQIADNSTTEDFMSHIFPYLQTAMKLTEPIQVLLIFMHKMQLLLKLTPAEEVKSDVLPMLYRALDSDAQQIQELCLSVLPTYATLIDYPAMKNALLPRIKRLCINTAYLSVRVNCLVCVGKLLEHLDKWLVLDQVLPFLQQIPSREPAVLMAILGIYKVTLTHKKLGIPKEVIATKVIPFLMPMTIENGLTLTQFNTMFAVLRDMVNRVETEHRAKVEQLNAITQETNSLNSNSTAPTTNSISAPTKVDLDSLFSGIEVGTPKTDNNGLSMDEKQRLVRQQDAAERFGTQAAPIAPMQAQHRPAPKPKDLTSTLLESNLANLAISNKSNHVMGASSSQAMNSSGGFNQQSTMTNFSHARIPAGGAINTFTAPTQAKPSFNWSQSPGIGTMQPMTLPQASFNSAQPMFNINNFSISPMTSVKNNAPQPSTGKSLSSSEINDLLS